jgi:hypothetical protein
MAQLLIDLTYINDEDYEKKYVFPDRCVDWMTLRRDRERVESALYGRGANASHCEDCEDEGCEQEGFERAHRNIEQGAFRKRAVVEGADRKNLQNPD